MGGGLSGMSESTAAAGSSPTDAPRSVPMCGCPVASALISTRSPEEVVAGFTREESARTTLSS